MKHNNYMHKKSFKEALESFCGHEVAEQEACDVQNALTQLVLALNEVEQEGTWENTLQGGIQ